VLCFTFAFWPLTAIVISTTSVLVAARNLQSAWLMRSMGEQTYRDWHLERLQETSITLYLFCLLGQTLLTAGVGLALVYFTSEERSIVPLAIGVGIIAYAMAVVFFTLLGIWRLRRSTLRDARLAKEKATRRISTTARPNDKTPAGDNETLLEREVSTLPQGMNDRH
jgi:hypothetical protein